ncbi:MAG: S8 family serine peptidase, partial [Woeseiaceae bacterium]|nr:S8 family serine peptidase [Woeseiaceae bacterium]
VLGRSIEANYQYQFVFNGFAAVMTADEAKALQSMNGVKSVFRDRNYSMTTDVGPEFIDAPAVLSGPPNNVGHSMGEGIVIAILDSGINSDHPSFADIGGDGYDHTNPLGSGNYIPGSYCDTVDPGFCNDKLIGAHTFVAEAVTPEDSDGHGSHTAATAAGNVVKDATLATATTSISRDITGVLPHANIIAYDVCIESCPGAALVAAVNQVVIDAAALPDGIHALNYSISGGGNPYNDPVEIGFLNATAAGVYVSASAGNSGPTPSTVAHLSPWVSTTAASTHNRTIVNSVVDMTSDGDSLPDIQGAGFTSGYGPAPIINSADLEAMFPGSTLCGLGSIGDFNPPWPPGTFNGEIVACTRGTFGRVEKGANALAAGAGGYILMDNGAGIVGDAHVLPGVHITQADGATLAAWLAANPNAQGSIAGYSVNLDASNGDIMAGFSSRGPNTRFDVLKPDISGPGVSVFAAEADDQAILKPEYQFLSGTSMSSPHNAGSGALISAVQPDWTPYMVKSALMMTAQRDTMLKEDGSTPADHFDMGAGRLNLSRAQEAGLVLDESPANFWFANPENGGDPKTLNIASMQDSNCVGECSWTRTVQNVTKHTIHVDLSTSGDDGVRYTTQPSGRLKVKAGESAQITVHADTTLAAEGWVFSNLEMARKGDGPDLHMPIAVYSARSTDSDLLNKTVDADTAAPGEPLNYEISITNGQLTGTINVSDTLPDGVSFVDGSESTVINNGSTTTPLSHSGGVVTWSGELDAGGLTIGPGGPPFGYVPLSIFTGPIGLPGNCDDGGLIFNVPQYNYNGQTYSQVIWSMNGTIEAGTASGVASSFANQNLPDPTPPNNIIAPFWRDLNPCAGGALRIAVLGAGGRQWTVYEWTDVPHFGSADAATFQVWIENITALNDDTVVHFTYNRVDNAGAGATVGAENADGTQGANWFYNGTGTPPAAGQHLTIGVQDGGSATLSFQATLDSCTEGEAVVNRADVTTADTENTAIAVTKCVAE